MGVQSTGWPCRVAAPTESTETVSTGVHTQDGEEKLVMSVDGEDENEPTKVPKGAKWDAVEIPDVDELVDEWEDECFPASDQPAHY